jgi:hypothetical protein
MKKENLINYKAASMHLTGKHGHIRGDYWPKKHDKAMKELLLMINIWKQRYSQNQTHENGEI